VAKREPKVVVGPYLQLDAEVFTLTLPDPLAWIKTCDYGYVSSVAELRAFVQLNLDEGFPIGLDWETTTLDLYGPTNIVVGLSVSIAPGVARYVPIGHFLHPELNVSWPEIKALLIEIDAHCDTVWYSYLFDGGVNKFHLQWEPTRWQDAIIGVFLENAGLRVYGLKQTSKRLLNKEMPEYLDVVGEAGNFAKLHPQDAFAYACADADVTRQIWLLPAVQRAVVQQNVIYRIEQRVCLVIRDGIHAGVYLDKEELLRLKADVARRLRDPETGLIAQLKVLMGEPPINLDSPKQLGERLVALGVPIEERTETKQVATGKDILAKYAAMENPHPALVMLVQYTELSTQESSYLDKLIAAEAHFGPHVRFAFSHIGVPTGRMKAGGEGKGKEAYGKGVVDANVQSIPDAAKKPAYLPDMRKAFVANPPGCDDYVFVVADYEQMQLRITANISREPEWVRAFLNHEDMHTKSAEFAYGSIRSIEDRAFGKTMNFAILFQASAGTVAAKAKIPKAKAQSLIDAYYARCPVLSSWLQQTGDAAVLSQSVTTEFGRVRPLNEFFVDGAPRWLVEKGKREAINTKVQGCEADIYKLAMHRLALAIRKAGLEDEVSQVLWVHDEVVVRTPRVHVEAVQALMKRALELPVKDWPVPLEVSFKVTPHWL
jgi:DNA polymerase-1